MYNDEIIEFSGGINSYIGKLEQSKHPQGPGWYRIIDPCLVIQKEGLETKQIKNTIATIWGPQKNFRKFVDIYVPPDSIMEVKVLDKDGELYKFYQTEISRKAPNLIVLPSMGVAGKVGRPN